jgi:hypothetical protein
VIPFTRNIIASIVLALALLTSAEVAANDVTMTTESVVCSQISGTCTITTIYWVYYDGQWWVQMVTKRVVPFPNWTAEK